MYCNGVPVDLVQGVLKVHIVVHWDGTTQRDVYQGKGEGFTSTTSGEVFKYKETDKVSWGEGIYTWHYHLKGNMGHDSMGVITWNLNTGELILGPTNCH